MGKQTKISPSDLRKQAQDLIRTGKMPSLDELLKAVAETRKGYAEIILEARKTSRRRAQ